MTICHKMEIHKSAYREALFLKNFFILSIAKT